jgi:hypothetical protein
MKYNKNPLAIALIGVERGLRGRDNGSDVNNVQYKSNWNCHYMLPSYNKFILIKKDLKGNNIMPHKKNQDLIISISLTEINIRLV